MTETSGSKVPTLEEMVNWLEYGIKTPLPHHYAVSLAPVCIKALEEVNGYRMFTELELPYGVHSTNISTAVRSNTCPAYTIVFRFDLTDWLNKGWDYLKRNENTETPNSE